MGAGGEAERAAGDLRGAAAEFVQAAIPNAAIEALGKHLKVAVLPCPTGIRGAADEPGFAVPCIWICSGMSCIATRCLDLAIAYRASQPVEFVSLRYSRNVWYMFRIGGSDLPSIGH